MNFSRNSTQFLRYRMKNLVIFLYAEIDYLQSFTIFFAAEILLIFGRLCVWLRNVKNIKQTNLMHFF